MLVESKMYASNFKKLNDPMEGAFLAFSLNSHAIDDIRNEKDGLRIISLIEKKEEKPCNMLMWSHYTDEHRGCCIEFHFDDENEEKNVYPIKYVKEIEVNQNETAKAILLRKFEDWKYEKEVRHIGIEEYVPIKIDKIYLGMRVDDMYTEDNTFENMYRKMISNINPDIKVVKMCAEDFDGHHLDTLKE
jgi:hypothetical protein